MAVKELPDLPSELLALAMEDLERVEAHSHTYQIFMGDWHQPAVDGGIRKKCSVCLGGAIMACTLGADPGKRYLPRDFCADTERKLNAIDNFRNGYVTQGFHDMGLTGGRPFDEPNVPTYGIDSAGFFRHMHRMIRNLANAGF